MVKRNLELLTLAAFASAPIGNERSLLSNNVFRRYVQEAIAIGEAFLVENQGSDGFWRDYALEPGPSEGWVTACVGWSIAAPPANRCYISSLHLAATILYRTRWASGWGYNQAAGPDADSTAWALRFLSIVNGFRISSAIATHLLTPYIDDKGAVHTFREPVFEAWADAHADVAPVVGLALLAVGAERSIINHVRQAVVSNREASGLWHSFWWSCDAYAIARSLEFLVATGGIPTQASLLVKAWISGNSVSSSSFEAAQELAIANVLGLSDRYVGLRSVERLLSLQKEDGSWPASEVLLTPPRDRESLISIPAFSDQQRLMSTAFSTKALKRWLWLVPA